MRRTPLLLLLPAAAAGHRPVLKPHPGTADLRVPANNQTIRAAIFVHPGEWQPTHLLMMRRRTAYRCQTPGSHCHRLPLPYLETRRQLSFIPHSGVLYHQIFIITVMSHEKVSLQNYLQRAQGPDRADAVQPVVWRDGSLYSGHPVVCVSGRRPTWPCLYLSPSTEGNSCSTSS